MGDAYAQQTDALSDGNDDHLVKHGVAIQIIQIQKFYCHKYSYNRLYHTDPHTRQSLSRVGGGILNRSVTAVNKGNSFDK